MSPKKKPTRRPKANAAKPRRHPGPKGGRGPTRPRPRPDLDPPEDDVVPVGDAETVVSEGPQAVDATAGEPVVLAQEDSFDEPWDHDAPDAPDPWSETDHVVAWDETDDAEAWDEAEGAEAWDEPESSEQLGVAALVPAGVGPARETAYHDRDDAAEPAAQPPPGAWAPVTVPRAPAPDLDERERSDTSRRSARGLVLLGVLCLFAVGFVGYLLVRPGSGGEHVGRMAAALQTTGDLAPDTSRVRTHVYPSGDMRVTQWIRTSNAISSLTLSVPRVAGLDVAAVQPAEVVVTLDGHQLPGATLTLRDGQATMLLPPTHRLVVSYVLSGAVSIDQHPLGRALARITALEASVAQPLSRTSYRVDAPRVLALACYHGTSASVPRPCGDGSGGTWQVETTGNRTTGVMAQVDFG